MADEKRQIFPARHELKYFVSPAELALLRTRLSPVMARDSHVDESGRYHIRSLYFDDAHDSAYEDKLAGVMVRDKYRIRIYNLSDESIYVERKRKQGNLIQKTSARITRRLCDQLMRGDPTGLMQSQNDLIRDIYTQMRTKLLRPKVIVDYWREPFVYAAENTRITFDTDVRSGGMSTDLFNRELLTVPARTDGREVLEVKFDNFLPSHIAGLLNDLRAERSAISKYTLCRRYGL